MNYKKACDILELDPYEKHTKNKIKKKYHLLALRFHPDKNKEMGAHEKFLSIHEAYQFLMEKEADPSQTIPTYEAIVRFFTGTLDQQIQQEYFNTALDKILSICEKQAIQVIDKMPYEKFIRIYNLLSKYKHIFPLTPEFYQAMEKKAIYWFSQGSLKKRENTEYFDYEYEEPSISDTVNAQTTPIQTTDELYKDYNIEFTDAELDASSNETMILRPSLDDIIIDNVYKCHYTDDNTNNKLSNPLYIPLWHHELTYDLENNKELTIKILPKLPSTNYWIDDENNVHQRIEYTLCELWDCVAEEKYLEVFFAKKRLIFYPQDLQLTMNQTWSWKNQGISKINTENIYDVSKRGDVVLHINITGII